MATFNNGDSGSSVRTKINNVLQHADGTAGELVINDAGGDVDFRVESDTLTNALFVDGATGNVGLGTSTPAERLDVRANTGANLVGQVKNDGAGRSIISVDSGGTSQAFFDMKNQGVLTARISSSPDNFLGFSAGPAGTERMRIDAAGNVGIGATPSAWGSAYKAVQLNFGSTYSAAFNMVGLAANSHTNGTNWIYNSSGQAVSRYEQLTGAHSWFTAAGGTAGATITFTQAMTLDASGNLLVGTTALAGTTSNATVVVNGGTRTATGTVSVPTATTTTLFSITAGNRGRYEVVAMLLNSGAPNLYTSMATILWDGTGSRLIANNGTGLTLTISGTDVQATQTSGVSLSIVWSFHRIAL